MNIIQFCGGLISVEYLKFRCDRINGSKFPLK